MAGPRARPPSGSKRLAPKLAVCLGSRHNRDLAAASFPVEEVYNAGRSLAETIDSWLGCEPLSRDLPRLHWSAQVG